MLRGAVLHSLVSVLSQSGPSLQCPASCISQHAFPGSGCLTAQQVNAHIFLVPFDQRCKLFLKHHDGSFGTDWATSSLRMRWSCWCHCAVSCCSYCSSLKQLGLPICTNDTLCDLLCTLNQRCLYLSGFFLFLSPVFPPGLGLLQSLTSCCSKGPNPWLASTTQTELWRRSPPSSLTRQVELSLCLILTVVHFAHCCRV